MFNVFFTFTGIISGNFGLESEVPADIANMVVSKLDAFLQSNKTIKLNRSCQIYFRILSTEHVKHRIAEGTLVPNRISAKPVQQQVGFSADKLKFARWKVKTPIGFPKQKEIFRQSCLLVSLVLGQVYNTFLKGNLSASRGFTKAQGQLVLDLVTELIQSVQLPMEGPHTLAACEVIAELWKVQIYVFSEQTPPTLVLFPKEVKPSRPSIYLFQRESSTAVSHLELIKDIIMLIVTLAQLPLLSLFVKVF